MSLCPQCHYHVQCSQSGLPDHLVRNILFMATSLDDESDLLALTDLLYGEELRETGLEKERVIALLNPLIPKCPYLN